MSIQKKSRVKSSTQCMGDQIIGKKFVPYENAAFVEQSNPEDLAQAIIVLGQPLVTLLKNMDSGQCNNAVVKAQIELSIECLRGSIKGLRNE